MSGGLLAATLIYQAYEKTRKLRKLTAVATFCLSIVQASLLKRPLPLPVSNQMAHLRRGSTTWP